MAAKVKDKLAEACILRDESMRKDTDRETIEHYWQDLAELCIPRKATFTEKTTTGHDRHRQVLDSTAPRALELFASFLHTILNNPALQWFRVLPVNPKLREDKDVKDWAAQVEKIMLDQFSSPSADLYTHLHSVYLDLGAFGTAVMYEEMVGKEFRVHQYHLEDCAFDENEAGFIDELFRQTRLKPKQAVQRWGEEAMEETVKRRLKSKGAERQERIKFLHCVFPTNDNELGPLLKEETRAKDMPFASVWVDTESRKTVQEGGFEEFPYQVPRWYRVRNEVHGRSPAMTVLSDIRMVNRMSETILRGAEKLVDPPLVLPDGGLVSPVRLFAGGLTFTEGGVEPKPLIPPGASRIEVGDKLLQDRQGAIREGFFVPLFITPDSPVKTATQVLQEVDERNRAVSPMLIRVQTELFHRFIARAFGLMRRANLFPPPPDKIKDASQLGIEYISPLTGSQKQVEALATLRVFESLAPWSEVDREVFDQFDVDAVGRIVHAGSGAPERMLLSPGKVAAKRQKRREAEAAQQEQANLLDAAEVGAKVTAAQNAGRRQR